mgnify:FL=1
MTYNFENKLPTKIKVGGELYSVEWFEVGSLISKAGDALMGQVEPDQHKIQLEKGQSLQALMDTVRHELTHVANHVYGVKDRMKEEDITDRSTKAWNDVWINNPKLVVWFSKIAAEIRKLSK